jgi:FlaA1/EpsC-like NDP-sugar epimerase
LVIARDMIRIYYPAGATDIPIDFTGQSPGEKLEESLFGPDEEAVETEHQFLLVARPSVAPAVPGVVCERVRQLETVAAGGDDVRLRALLSGDLAAAASEA